jgi:hypothetical protein
MYFFSSIICFIIATYNFIEILSKSYSFGPYFSIVLDKIIDYSLVSILILFSIFFLFKAFKNRKSREDSNNTKKCS